MIHALLIAALLGGTVATQTVLVEVKPAVIASDPRQDPQMHCVPADGGTVCVPEEV